MTVAERIGDRTCNVGGDIAGSGRRDIDLACMAFAFDGGDCDVSVRGGVPMSAPDCTLPRERFFPIKEIGQALRDDTCNDESQRINLNCHFFGFDKGNPECQPPDGTGEVP